MVKKNSKITKKQNKMFKELRNNEIPDNIKDILENNNAKAISGRERDFVNLQKDLHENFYNLKIIESELQIMIEQIKLPLSERTMKWNGMIIPDIVLKARTGKKNVDYIAMIHFIEGMKKNLILQGLTEKQLEIIMLEGKYVKELPNKSINTGEVGE